MLSNGHDYSLAEDEPTIPSFRIDLRRGRIVNQFGMTALRVPKLQFDFEFRFGIGLSLFWNKFDRSVEITIPFLKMWIHRS